jgi:M-phase inducer tyrosine phosphatase
MQVFSATSSANSQSHSQLSVSVLSTKAIQYVQGTEDNVEDLSSDLETPSTLSMSFHPSLPGPVRLVDNVAREDVVPMDISPEPSRVVHQSRIASGHFLEKVTRARAFTTSVRLFGCDLSNGTPISPASSLCESGATIASCVRLVSSQARSRNLL